MRNGQGVAPPAPQPSTEFEPAGDVTTSLRRWSLCPPYFVLVSEGVTSSWGWSTAGEGLVDSIYKVPQDARGRHDGERAWRPLSFRRRRQLFSWANVTPRRRTWRSSSRHLRRP